MKPVVKVRHHAVLEIEIAKGADGGGTLSCRRADGSITWQKQAKHAAHFALHDLTHFAVETSLRYRGGFFGLIADGWDVEDTTGKGTRGAAPPEAVEVERIVGLFDSERGSGALWTTEEFNQFAPRPLSGDEIQNVRSAGRSSSSSGSPLRRAGNSGCSSSACKSFAGCLGRTDGSVRLFWHRCPEKSIFASIENPARQEPGL